VIRGISALAAVFTNSLRDHAPALIDPPGFTLKRDPNPVGALRPIRPVFPGLKSETNLTDQLILVASFIESVINSVVAPPLGDIIYRMASPVFRLISTFGA
jgi:hypothetical protein